jgi:hypothetical protein
MQELFNFLETQIIQLVFVRYWNRTLRKGICIIIIIIVIIIRRVISRDLRETSGSHLTCALPSSTGSLRRLLPHR